MRKAFQNFAWLAVLSLCGSAFVGCDEDDSSTFGEQGGTAGSSGSGSGGTGGGTGGVTLGGSGGGGGSPGQDGSGGGGNCPDWGDDPDCKECLKSNCCSQTARCNNDAGCKAVVECSLLCPEPNNGNSECVRSCIADAGSALDAFNATLICMGTAPCDQLCAHL